MVERSWKIFRLTREPGVILGPSLHGQHLHQWVDAAFVTDVMDVMDVTDIDADSNADSDSDSDADADAGWPSSEMGGVCDVGCGFGCYNSYNFDCDLCYDCDCNSCWGCFLIVSRYCNS